MPNPVVLISRTQKNMNRKYWSCSEKDENRCPKNKRFIEFVPNDHPDQQITPLNAEPKRDRSPTRAPSVGAEYAYGYQAVKSEPQFVGAPGQPYNDRPSNPVHVSAAASLDATSVHQKLNQLEALVKSEFAFVRNRLDGLTTMAINIQNELSSLKAAQCGNLNVVPMSDYQ